jgi:hypothetical protein
VRLAVLFPAINKSIVPTVDFAETVHLLFSVGIVLGLIGNVHPDRSTIIADFTALLWALANDTVPTIGLAQELNNAIFYGFS